MISEATLKLLYGGKAISAICGMGYTKPVDNHCAHFVSHALGYCFGTTCLTMGTGSRNGLPGTIRVDQLFSRCLAVGEWNKMPAHLLSGLVFITGKFDVHLARRSMDQVGKKHVGIFFRASQHIWHYSNDQHLVICQTPAQFKLHFPSGHNDMYWGEVP